MNVNKEVSELLKDIGVPVSFLVCNQNPKPQIYVTYFEVVAVETEYADDKATTQEINIQVDIWAIYGHSITKLKENIIENMKNSGWILKKKGSDMYEPSTNTQHKPLEFYFKEVL